MSGTWKPASELTGQSRWIWGVWGWYGDAEMSPAWWDSGTPDKAWSFDDPEGSSSSLPDMFAECEPPQLPPIDVRRPWKQKTVSAPGSFCPRCDNDVSDVLYDSSWWYPGDPDEGMTQDQVTWGVQSCPACGHQWETGPTQGKFPRLSVYAEPNEKVAAELQAAGIEPAERLSVWIDADGFRLAGREVDGTFNGWSFRRFRFNWWAAGPQETIRETPGEGIWFQGADKGRACYSIETPAALRRFVEALK